MESENGKVRLPKEVRLFVVLWERLFDGRRLLFALFAPLKSKEKSFHTPPCGSNELKMENQLGGKGGTGGKGSNGDNSSNGGKGVNGGDGGNGGNGGKSQTLLRRRF